MRVVLVLLLVVRLALWLWYDVVIAVFIVVIRSYRIHNLVVYYGNVLVMTL